MSRVSLIVPVYNAAAFLPALLDWLRAQEEDGLQVIFSDDGSRDDSLVLLRRYAEEDPRAVVVAGENRGVSAARNRALALAGGDYIGFLDADDVPEPGYLSGLLEALESSGADMACCGFTRIYEKSGVQDALPTGRRAREVVDRDGMARLLLRPDGYTTVMWNKLFRRAALTGGDGQLLKFDETLHIVEDGEYIFRSRTESAVFFPDRLYRYAVRDTGAMYGRLTERKKTELEARRRIVALTADLAPDVQDLAKMKYQKGVRDLLFHAVIAGDGSQIQTLRPQMNVWKRELFASPALSGKEKLKYHVYRPIIDWNLRTVGAFLMKHLSGH